MRALGPGSVSSFLKVVLDVVYIIVWVVLAVLSAAAVGLLVFQPFVTNVVQLDLGGLDHSRATSLTGRASAVAGLLLLASAYAGLLIVILYRLRKVFETLIRGDPFKSENVARLRGVGLALIALEGAGFAFHTASQLILAPRSGRSVLYLNLSGWFAILVVFVLAEVFREGARLREDAELTI